MSDPIGRSKKPPRFWIKLDVDFFDDPKVAELSDAAQLLYLSGLLLAKSLNTDGEVTLAQMRRRRQGDIEPLVKEIVDQGLWTVTDDGAYRAGGWPNWNR